MKGTRCFVAIELDDRVRDALVRARGATILRAPEWANEKWVAAENLHLTLAFLGELDSSRLTEVSSRLAASLPSLQAFSLCLDTLVAVPPRGRHTMIWATVIDTTGRCKELAQTVTTIAAERGVALADKPFAPHVTLVRARRPRRISGEVIAVVSAESLGDGVSMSVPSATFYSSALTPVGPVYERLAQWSFSESA